MCCSAMTVGPYIVHRLESEYAFGDEVEVVDVGTPALDLMHRIDGLDAVIFVDSVMSNDTPGAVLLYRKEGIVRTAPAPRLDPHSPALSECLLMAEMLGSSPREVLLIGVVGESYQGGEPLSALVRGAVDAAIACVLEELQTVGGRIPEEGVCERERGRDR